MKSKRIHGWSLPTIAYGLADNKKPRKTARIKGGVRVDKMRLMRFALMIGLVLVFIAPQNVFASSGYRIIVQANDNITGIISDLGDGYYVVASESNNKQGICRANGELIVPALYDSFSDYFENGTVVAVNGGNKGLLDLRAASAGNDYALLSSKYLDICYMSDNRYLVRTGGNQWGVVDREDKPVTEYLPGGYKVEGWDDLYNRMDSQKVTLSLKRSGFLRIRGNGKYGLMDSSLHIVIPIEYEYLDILGRNSVIAVQNDKYGLLDTSGHTLIPTQYRFVARANENNYICYTNDGCEMYDISNKVILFPNKYDDLIPVAADLLIAKLNGKYGAIDISGKQMEPFIYDDMWVDDVPDNMFCYLSRPPYANYKIVPELTSYLSPKVSSYWFQSSDYYNDKPRNAKKILSAIKGGKHYLLDPKNILATPSEGYDAIIDSYGGGAVIDRNGIIIKNGGKYGLIDLSGRELIPPVYDIMEIPYENPANYSGINYIFVYRDGMYAVLNSENKVVTPFTIYPEAPNHASIDNYVISSETGLIKKLWISTTTGDDNYDYAHLTLDPPIPDVSIMQSFNSQPFDSKDGLLYLAVYKEKPALISFSGGIPQWSSLQLAAGSSVYYTYGISHSAPLKPYISNKGRIMIPVSSVSEMLGLNVAFFKDRTVISKDGVLMNVRAGSLDNAACMVLKDGELFISLRDLADYFGYLVTWDPDGQKAAVYAY